MSDPKVDVAIIDSGGANISSIVFAFERLGCKPRFTGDWDVIRSASHVVLPGVGSAGAAMERLDELGLVAKIPKLEQPVIGICLGMQLLFEESEEGGVACLGVIPERVRRIPISADLTVPHTGWNQSRLTKFGETQGVFRGIPSRFYSYFVHSFAAPVCEWTVATCQHGIQFSSMVARKNFTGIQFHPERSSSIGHELLRRFLNSNAKRSVCRD